MFFLFPELATGTCLRGCRTPLQRCSREKLQVTGADDRSAAKGSRQNLRRVVASLSGPHGHLKHASTVDVSDALAIPFERVPWRTRSSCP